MITPEQLAKPDTEDANQMALMAWCAVAKTYGANVADAWNSGMGIEAAKTSFSNRKPLPELEWLHHIPNGEQTKERGAKMRAMGLKSGVWDLHLPVRRAGYCGLYIEMKQRNRLHTKNGGLSENQVYFGNFVEAQGYCLRVCYSWEEASKALTYYLAL